MDGYVKLSDVLRILDECRCSDCSNDQDNHCELCQFNDFYNALLTSAIEVDVVSREEYERLQLELNAARERSEYRSESDILEILELRQRVEDLTDIVEELRSKIKAFEENGG